MRKELRTRLLRPSNIIILTAVVLIFFHYIGVLRPLENTIVRSFSSVQHFLFKTGNKMNSGSRENISYAELVSQNELLIEQTNSLTVENSRLRSLLEQNEIISEQLEFLEDFNYSYVNAKIVGYEPISDQNIIIIDKGSRDGVLPEMPIIVRNGVLVGKIIDVDPDISRVLLITDSLSQVAAKIEGLDQTTGIVTGEHGLTMKMELIPQEIAIQEGQVIVTSGLERNIPTGLIIGKISRIERDKNNFFQTAFLQPIIQYNTVNVVSILIDG